MTNEQLIKTIEKDRIPRNFKNLLFFWKKDPKEKNQKIQGYIPARKSTALYRVQEHDPAFI